MDAATHKAAIRQHAYAIWEDDGRSQGREWDHWVQASQAILSRTSVELEAAPTAKSRTSTKDRIRAALKSAISV